MTTRPLVLLGLLLLAMPLDTAGPGNSKQYQRAQQQGYSAKPTTDTTTATIKRVIHQTTPTTQLAGYACYQGTNPAPWWQRLTDDPVAVLTLLILFVYVGLFALGWCQTKAVIRAADAAKLSADSASATLKLQRARIKVEGADSAKYVPPAHGDPPTKAYGGISQGTMVYINLAIANRGKTPADKVLLCSTLQYTSVHLTEIDSEKRVTHFSEAFGFEEDCKRVTKELTDFEDVDMANAEVYGRLPIQLRRVGVVFPGEPIIETVRWGGVDTGAPSWSGLVDRFYEGQLVSIQRQEACIVVIARMRYQDIFEEWHNTLYCARWQPPSTDLVILPYGNYAD